MTDRRYNVYKWRVIKERKWIISCKTCCNIDGIASWFRVRQAGARLGRYVIGLELILNAINIPPFVKRFKYASKLALPMIIEKKYFH